MMCSKCWLVPCAVAVAAGLVLLINPAREAKIESPGIPDGEPQVLVVLNGSDDMGLLNPDEGEVQHRVTLRNVSGRKARILDVQTGCGCMDAQLSKHDIGPDETTELQVLLRVPNGVSSLHKALVLRTDDPEHPLATVSLHGRVDARLAVRPARIDFAPVPASDLPLVRELSVSGASGPLQVSSRDGVVAVEQVLEGEGVKIRVLLHRAGEGPVQDAILVASETGEQMTIPVAGAITPEVRFSPESVVLVEGGIGDGAPVEVAVHWGRESADIASLHVSDGLHVECPGEGKPDKLMVSRSHLPTETSEAAIGIRTVDGKEYRLPVYIMTGTL